MPQRSSSLPWPVWMIAAVVTLAHLVTASGYGIFRDEMYYLNCADHLDWGYVDHPPLSIAVLAAIRAVLGDSLFALRFLPALLHGLLVLGTARLATHLGAEALGTSLAALCVAVAPGFLGMTSLYSMNAFDLIFHVAAFLVFAEILSRGPAHPAAPSTTSAAPISASTTSFPSSGGDLAPAAAARVPTRSWLLLGLVLGLGLLNKYSVGLLALGLAIGFLLSGRRRELRTSGPWIALGITIVLFAPHVIWEARTGWPTREFIANAQEYKISNLTPWQFWAQVWLETQPVSILVWLAGGIALLFFKPLAPMRPLGVAWLVVAFVLTAQKSKPYYMNAIFPLLFAAGGSVWDQIARTPRGRWMPWVLVPMLAVSGIAIAPYAIPVLPPETFLGYGRGLGIGGGASGESHDMGPFPQHFADRFGWPEMAQTMAEAYRSLSPEEQRSCLIVGQNYGQAGAINYYGRRLGLPSAVSQHNSFYLWGPGGDRFDVVLSIGHSREDLLGAFESVTEVARFDHPYAMPYERDSPVYLCRGWRLPVEAEWRRGKLYL